MQYELEYSVDEQSDEDFVIDIFAQSLVVQWMRHNLDTTLAISTMVGGKEEKMLKNDLKANLDRLNSLELKLQKAIRNHGYYNGNYSTGSQA